MTSFVQFGLKIKIQLMTFVYMMHTYICISIHFGQLLEILKEKWECANMDFIVGLTPTRQGHDAIFVC
jgi:hypothetical protein